MEVVLVDMGVAIMHNMRSTSHFPCLSPISQQVEVQGQYMWFKVVHSAAKTPCIMILFVLDFMMATPRSALMDCIVASLGPHMLFCNIF